MDLLLDGQQLARVLEVEFCGKGEPEVLEDNDVDFDMDLGGSDDMGLLYSKVWVVEHMALSTLPLGVDTHDLEVEDDKVG